MFSIFFSVASKNLLAQSYTARVKEENSLTRGIIEIINELLTTLVYKAPPTVTEREAAIFLETLIQRINGFERTPSSGPIKN